MAKKKKKAQKNAKKRPLTPAREAFVAAYLANGQNATDAYRTAYPRATTRTCEVEGGRLLRNPVVKAKIAAALQKRLNRYEVTSDRIIEELASIAFLDSAQLYDRSGDLVPIHDLPERVRCAICQIETESSGGDDGGVRVSKVKTNSKLKALELLAKLACGMAEKVEHTGTVTNIVVDTGVPRGSDD